MIRALCWLLLAALGAVAGWRAALSVGHARSEGAPEGWSTVEAQVPFRLPELAGELPLTLEAWSLDHFRGITSPPAEGPVEVEVTVPVEGAVQIGLGEPRPDGRQLVFVARRPSAELRDASPPVVVWKLPTGAEEQIVCDGRLLSPPDDRWRFAFSAPGKTLEILAGDQRARCRVPWEGPVTVKAGLKRVHLHALSSDAWSLPRPLDPRAPPAGAALGALLALLVAALERRHGARWSSTVLTALPLAICGALLETEGAAVAHTLRISGVSPHALPVLAGLGPALLLKALHLAGRLARGRPGALGALLAAGAPAALAVGACLALEAGYIWTTLGVAGAAAAAGLTLWANVNTVRGFNLISLALVVLGTVSLEYGLRWTQAGISWAPGAAAPTDLERARAWSEGGAGEELDGAMTADPLLGWITRSAAEVEALEAADPEAVWAPEAVGSVPAPLYPDERTPDAARKQIVCLGGSSTAGAVQTQDPRIFYPNQLDVILGDEVEVFNQGVGGWTTFHIARYAQRSLAALEPDVVTLYVGHNDLYQMTVLPYAQLYARWQEAPNQTVGAWLQSVRLYQGLRFLVQGVRPATLQPAVPVADARENLRAVIVASRGAGAKVLLMSEGIHPDPSKLSDYWAMMAGLAEESEGVEYMDAAALLHEEGDNAFIDDCHLSILGHRALSRAMRTRLYELGWVPEVD
jgi:lysophospholipase L1-like esterase